jgi:hypothetical protein
LLQKCFRITALNIFLSKISAEGGGGGKGPSVVDASITEAKGEKL